jgi:hypothetical protein
MALFARDNVGIPAFIMLASTASRLLESLRVSWSSTGRVIGMEETEQYEQVCRAIHVFENSIREFLVSKAALDGSLTQLAEPERQVENHGDTIGCRSDII